LTSSSQASPHDFDPFLVLPPPLRAIQRLPAWGITFLLPIFLAVILVATALDGTVGGSSDFRPIQDIKTALGLGQPPPTPASFPFLRDFTSMALLCAVVATSVVVHLQWKLFATCISGLMTSGALTPRQAPLFRRHHRLLRIDRAGSEFQSFIGRTNSRLARWGDFSFLIVLAACGIATIFVVGLQHVGLFRILTPRPYSENNPAIFSHNAYNNWWASINHVWGVITYGGLAAFEVCLMLWQNIVGVFAVYIAVALPAYYEYSLDPLVPADNYGWGPLATAFRTVRLSLAIHAFMITILLVVINIRIWIWTIVPFCTWLFAVCLYLPVPWAVFRHVKGEWQRRRRAEMQSSFMSMSEADRLAAEASLVEIVKSVKLRPLSRQPVLTLTFAATILLPIVLTIVQIVVPLRFGPH